MACKYHDSSEVGQGKHRSIAPASQPASKNDSGLRLHARIKHNDFGEPEVFYFDLFRNLIVDNLCQNGYMSLWSRTILCESFRDECVRDCVLGIGALCRALMVDNQYVDVRMAPIWSVPTIAVSCPNSKYHQDAIKHYAKSISRFRSRISREGSSIPSRTILIISILLIIFETIEGNTESVDRVMHAAITALKVNLRQDMDTKYQISPALDDEGVREADYFLTRLSGFGSLLSPFYPSLLKSHGYQRSELFDGVIPSSTSTPHQIELAFEKYTTSALIWCFRTVQTNTRGRSLDPIEHQEEQLAISSQANDWCDFITENLKQETDPLRRQTWKVMLVEAKMYSIYTTYCRDAEETELMWDSRVADCRDAVTLAESVLDEPSPFNALPPLFEEKLLPTLRCFVCKCRDQETRARALALCTRLAGPWFENKAILAALQIMIALEEQDRDALGFIPIRLRYRWNESSWNDDRSELRMVLTGIITGARKEFTIRQSGSIDDVIKKLTEVPNPTSTESFAQL